jgi:5-methylcytosine-specific restriction endonuclease McrA
MQFTEDKWLNKETTAKWREQKHKELVESIDTELYPLMLKSAYPDLYKQVCSMIKRHPDYNTERFSNMINIQVGLNITNHLEFRVVNTDGIRTFSLKTCCKKTIVTPEKSEKDKLHNAMRTAIYPQIQKFKNNEPSICERCNQLFHESDLQVDHKKPVTFKSLKNAFLNREWKGSIPTKFTKSGELNNDNSQFDAFLEEDKDFEDAWYKFHEYNAVLRPLCVPCHKEVAKKNVT